MEHEVDGGGVVIAFIIGIIFLLAAFGDGHSDNYYPDPISADEGALPF